MQTTRRHPRTNPRGGKNAAVGAISAGDLLRLCVLVASGALVLSTTPPARAQAEPEAPPAAEPEPPAKPAPEAVDLEDEAEAPPPKAQPAAPPPAAPAPAEPPPPAAKAEPEGRPSSEKLMRASPGAAPWVRETGWYRSTTALNWGGGLEVDVGYANYSFKTATFPPEEFFDFRGRFVLGPDVRYDFGPGDNYFFRAKGEFVAWVREQYNLYQVNVDDVFAQVGNYGLWDVMLGRFMTWRVYRKGLGFDLYTLEDTGALVQGPFEGGRFGVHIYEVDNIFYRETPGRLAFHLYPTTWSGIELAGQYGKDATSNTAGGRLAANVHFDFVSVSAAAEYRFFRPAVEQRSTQPDGTTVSCDDCGIIKRSGYGGGVVFTLKPVEAGFNAARGFQDSYAIKDG